MKKISWSEIKRLVQRRAKGRCEYCRMHQALQGATYHMEHIRPKSLRGESTLENLAWACPACNMHKATRISGRDPHSGRKVALFNPRADIWSEHFRWEGFEIAGLTEMGRATVAALDLNNVDRQLIRSAEMRLGLFDGD